MYEFLSIDIKTLDDGGFQFYQNGLIRKFLEATGMKHCNGLPTPTKVETPLVTYANGYAAKIDWPNSYGSVIVMMLYLHQTQDQIYHFLFTSVPVLHITPRHHTRQL